MRNMTDEQLLTKYLETKDNDLFSEIDQRMRPRLYAFGIRLAKSHDGADDLVQEALLKLIELDAPSDPIRSAESFLFRMMQNIHADQKRADKRSVRDGMVSLSDFEESELDDTDEAGNHVRQPYVLSSKNSISTESQARARELQERAMSALDSLPPKQKAAVELYHCRSMTAAETAGILKTNEGSVEKQVEAGIQSLRKMLGANARTRPRIRPVRATDLENGIDITYPRLEDAKKAGYNKAGIWRSIRKGVTYKGLTWSYACAT